MLLVSHKNKATIKLYNRKVGDSGAQIGDARVYTFNLTDAAYSGASTKYDLRLYDIQTYTKITVLNQSVDATDMPDGSYIKGKIVVLVDILSMLVVDQHSLT